MAAVDPRAALTAMIGRTTAELGTLGARNAVSWRFARAWLALARFEAQSHAEEDLAAALADFDAMPATLPERPMLATMIAVSRVRYGIPYSATDTVARLAALADIVDAAPPPLPDWPCVSAVIRVRDLADAAMHGREGFELRAALAEVKRLADVVGTAQPYAVMIASLRQGLELERRRTESDRSSVSHAQEFGDYARQMTEWADSLPQDGYGPATKARVDAQLIVVRLMLEVQSAALRSDLRAIAAGLRDLEAAAEKLPAGSPDREMAANLISAVGRFTAVMNEGEAPSAEPWDPEARFLKPMPDDILKAMEDAADQPGLAPGEALLRRFNLALALFSQDTPQAVDRAVTGMQQILAEASPDDPRFPTYLLGAGEAIIRRFEQRRESQDLLEGISLLDDCRACSGSTTHYLWTTAAMPLALAYRLAGRKALDRARRVARPGLGRTAPAGCRRHALGGPVRRGHRPRRGPLVSGRPRLGSGGSRGGIRTGPDRLSVHGNPDAEGPASHARE